jgi:uncharacterized protein (TIGR02757 family)
MRDNEIKEFLDEKYELFNNPNFIESDPIQIPQRFSKKEDIEIAAFLSSEIAWGKRSMIIRNADKIMNILQNNPHEFILNASFTDFEAALNGGHRTFKGEDLFFFLKSLQNIYRNHGGLENVFTNGYNVDKTVFSAIANFRKVFFEQEHLKRTEKHIADVLKKSAAKRINMFLMWLVRKDNSGVHFGLWNKIPSSALKMPLDVHSGNTARALGILKRTQNDWFSVEELTGKLAEFDPNDPVKYDFALFGLGVFEGFGREK